MSIRRRGLRVAAVTTATLLTALVATPAAQAADPRRVAVDLVPFTETRFDSPTAIAHAGDGRLFVAERGGLVKRVTSSGVVASKAYLDLRPFVQSGGEQGLLGLAFHPQFASKPFVYAAFTRPDGSLQVNRYRAASASATGVDVATRYPLLNVPHPHASNHNGGDLAFGPDGMLYISTGDGGATPHLSQRLDSLLGKILRIDVNRACSPKRYCIPASNPFRGVSRARPEIWHLGLRNPWRMSFDRTTGALWIADVGQSRWEEINRVNKGVGGKNFGWPCREGRVAHDGSCRSGTLTNPVDVYSHDLGCSVTGGVQYRGSRHPRLAGVYVFADFCSGRIWGRSYVSGRWVRTQIGSYGGGISEFGENAAGEMFALDLYGGRLLSVRARPR